MSKESRNPGHGAGDVVVDGVSAGRESGGAPGQQLLAPQALPFWELIRWLGDKLERLLRESSSAELRTSLHALVRACDPATNPRLQAALEQGAGPDEPASGVPPLDRDQVERLHARLKRCDRALREILFENGRSEHLQGAADHSQSVIWFLERFLEDGGED